MSIYETTEADEASRTKAQALEALAYIYRDNGPGNLTQSYEDAARSKGASVEECEAVYASNRKPDLPGGQLVVDVYETALKHGWDARTQGCMALARNAGVPEMELHLLVFAMHAGGWR